MRNRPSVQRQRQFRSTLARFIKPIPFTDANQLSVELPVPAIVHPGEIVSIAITIADGSKESEIYLKQSAGYDLLAGHYSGIALLFPTDTETDDLFGSE